MYRTTILLLTCLLVTASANRKIKRQLFPLFAQIRCPSFWSKHSDFLNCGGSVIGENVILTAAHCVVLRTDNFVEKIEYRIAEPSRVHVYVGKVDPYGPDVNQRRSVTSIIVHEEYNSLTYQNDIALIVLEENLDISNVSKMFLPHGAHYQMYNTKSKIITIGRSAGVRLIKQTIETCPIKEARHNILEGMMCSKSSRSIHRVTNGDSGCPLLAQSGDKFILLGIVSWGVRERLRTKDSVDVSTNVSTYADWIHEKLGQVNVMYTVSLEANNKEQRQEVHVSDHFQFRYTHIAPKDKSKFIEVMIDEMNNMDEVNAKNYCYLKVYDGSSTATSPLLAVISVSDQRFQKVFTSTTNQGLIIAVTTTDLGNPEIFLSYSYRQVPKGSKQSHLSCPSEWGACTNKLWCVKKQSFCNGLPECSDKSDEDDALCKRDVKLIKEGRSKGIVAIKKEGGYTWGLICTDELSPSIGSTICKNLNYKFGSTINSQPFDVEQKLKFSVTRLQCPDHYSDLAKCGFKDYDAAVPCAITEALAVSCTNAEWDLKMNIKIDSLKNDNSVKEFTRFIITLEKVIVLKFGTRIPLKNFISTSIRVFNRNHNGTYISIDLNEGQLEGSVKLDRSACLIGLVVIENRFVLAEKVDDACNYPITKEKINEETKGKLSNLLKDINFLVN